MKTKFKLTLLLGILMILKAQAQISFIPKSFSTSAVESVYSMCEIAPNRYLFTGTRSDADSSCFVFISDDKGKVLRYRQLFLKRSASQEDYSRSCFLNADGSISLVGSGVCGSARVCDSLLWIARIDTNLNLLSYTAHNYNIGDSALYQVTPFIQLGQHFYGAITYTNYKEPPFVKLLKLSSTGILIGSRNLDTSFFGKKYRLSSISSVHPSARAGEIILAGGDRYFSIVDTNLSLVQTIDMTDFIGLDTSLDLLQTNLIGISGNNFIAGIGLNALSFPSKAAWGILKYNLLKKEVTAAGAFPCSLDTYKRGRNTAFVSMAKSADAVYTLGFTSGPQAHIVVAKFDTMARPQWIQYIGDSIDTRLATSINVCKDGSIMVCGQLMTSTQNAEDFYVLKLDPENGAVLSSNSLSKKNSSAIDVFPNPADKDLYIRGAALGSHFEVYTIEGQLVLQGIIDLSDYHIGIQNLANGNYFYQITDDQNQEIKLGTWTKQ